MVHDIVNFYFIEFPATVFVIMESLSLKKYLPQTKDNINNNYVFSGPVSHNLQHPSTPTRPLPTQPPALPPAPQEEEEEEENSEKKRKEKKGKEKKRNGKKHQQSKGNEKKSTQKKI